LRYRHAPGGKTTFLHQLLAERRAILPAERAFYLSFDDDRLAGLELEQLGFLLEEYYRRYPALRGRKTVYWFLDEIQLVPGWERFVRRVMDSERLSSSLRLLGMDALA
jgi:predicted AAA+ superfamily ATPase